jgi:PEP-CTERM motif
VRTPRIAFAVLNVAAILSAVSAVNAQITGFGGASMAGWTANHSNSGPVASVVGPGDASDILTITSAVNDNNNSYFFDTPQPMTTQGWTASWTYTLTDGSIPPADGITMTLQNDPRGASALGEGGGRLGYGGGFPNPPTDPLVNGTSGIINSEAFLLNVYSGDGGVGIDQFLNAGTRGAAGSRTFTSVAPVDPTLVNTPVNVTLSFDGASTLTASLAQQAAAGGTNTFSTSFSLPSYQQVLGGGNSFLVGFTGATGGLNAGQTISGFTFTPNGAQIAPSLNILGPTDIVVGVNANPVGGTGANSPAGEPAFKSLDSNVETKYLNFNKLNAGIVVTPAVGPTIATELGLTSANDAPERDPSSYQVWGTNDNNLSDISPELNPDGWQAFYTLISSGDVAPFPGRLTEQDIFFVNTTAYSSYLIDFPTVVDPNGDANSMQIANIQLSGSAVPEPSSMALLAVGGLGLFLVRRRPRS